MPCATTTLTALALTLSISWIAGAQPTLYLTDARAGKIQTMDLADGTTEDVLFATNQSPENIAVDVDEGKIYWTSPSPSKTGSTIRRANLDGSEIEDLAETGYPPISDLALDLRNHKMYWTTWDYWAPHHSGAVYRSNLDGSDLESVHDGGVFAIALDPDAGKMYFADGYLEGEYRIRRANLDGSDPMDLIPGAAYAIAVDTRAGMLYYSVGRAIKRAKLDGSKGEYLVIDSYLIGISLDLTQGKMYWTSRSRVRRANLDGSDVEDILVSADAEYQDVFVDNPESSKATAVTYEQPAEFNLDAAYPNPFNPSTTIRYALGSSEHTTVKVRNALGRIVAVLVDEDRPAGTHRVIWAADRDQPSGVYFYTLETGSGAVTKSMLLLK